MIIAWKESGRTVTAFGAAREPGASTFFAKGLSTDERRLGRLGAARGLNLALLVHTQDDRPLGRSHVQPDHIPNHLGEEPVGRQLERLVQVWLETERPPGPSDGGLGQVLIASQGSGAPVGGVLGFGFEVRASARSTWVSVTVRGAPGRDSSVSPSSREAANRVRHLRTVGRVSRRSEAMAVLGRPSAARTMRARIANRCWVVGRRAQSLSSSRSPSVKVSC